MRKINILIVLAVFVGSVEVFACNSGSLRKTPEEIARKWSGRALACTKNKVKSEGRISLLYPRCPGGKPIVRLTAFGTGVTVNEIKENGKKIIIQSDELKTAVSCELKSKTKQ